MSAPPYMRLYWGDYHRDTAHLTRAEHGSYMMLLSALWNGGGKVAADDVTLARLALCPADEWPATRAVLLPFFRVVRGKLTHKRVTAELAKYESTIGKRKEAGKAGGTARAGKQRENSEANAKQMPSKSPHNQNQNQKEGSEDKSSDGGAVVLDFDADAWTAGVGLLTGAGIPEKAARSFFGKLLSTNGLQARDLLALVTAARVNNTRDPQSYLTKGAENIARRRAPAPAKRVGFV